MGWLAWWRGRRRPAARGESKAKREMDELRQRCDALVLDRDRKIDELEATIRLRELEIRGQQEIIERDRQRREAETAIHIARAEAAGRRRSQEVTRHGFIP